MDKDHGRVIRVTGQIVEVEFAENPPDLHDLLILEDDKTTKMEVMRSSGPSTFYSLCFSETTRIYRGARVINTKESVTVPVGEGVLGRVMDIFGEPLDGLGEIKHQERRTIYGNYPSYTDISTHQEIL